MSAESIKHTDIAIIGAGFGGIVAAARLLQHGFRNFTVLEKENSVGGTWRDNNYPGCACDVPSHLYSLAFHLNPDWSDTFAGQGEIWDYLRTAVKELGIEPHIRFNHEVDTVVWEDDRQQWNIDTNQGTMTARIVIAAPGPLSDPSIPKIEGIDEFAGETFHSSEWNHDYDLTNREVAVIGTGASAIQFVPKIQPQVKKLNLFQRTPPWIMPRTSRTVGPLEKAFYRNVPGANRLRRTALYWGRETWALGFLNPSIMRRVQKISRLHLNRQVSDPELKDKLIPDYTMGCKRILLSNTYWRSLDQDNAEVVTNGIRHIDRTGIVTSDGHHHRADAIIWGTGFHVTDPPIAQMVTGRGGQKLAEAWSPSMRSYKSTTFSGFPNFFMMLGPNSALGHNSVVLMVEAQMQQVIKALKYMRKHRKRSVEPTALAQKAYHQRIAKKMKGTVWVAGGCDSWYLDSTNTNTTVWPGFVPTFRLMQNRFQPSHYLLR
ncbi:flavin-containing monooxygenase [Haloglycomyces albus]|uniref:flavin-containing monooxygenase n=1 Tax=Haloglycomyces albus TaxID=526067 RepID=UPI00046D132D|nr:NAD(P)/FAD-dependent oxidoreductase [Haloglycomyces albus]